MPFIPLSQAFATGSFHHVRLIATDMDGTLTTNGLFSAALLQRLEQLRDSGLQVILVTGRSAGWVSGLVSYLPIAGAIAENGGVFLPGDRTTEIMLVPVPAVLAHRQRLAEVFDRLQIEFPYLQESADNRFRITDWTFEIAGLSLDELQTLRHYCHSWGWGFTYSNVQCHIQLPQQNKAAGLIQVIHQVYGSHTPQQVLTVGDSVNDETLFDPNSFPLSVGVANVAHYRDQLRHQPAYITQAAEGAGFCELADQFVQRLRPD